MKNLKGLVIIVSSPSGAGKTTVTRKILQKFKNSYLSVSCTTRKPRPGEKNGKDYFFISKEEFTSLKKKNKFIESAKVYDHYYGTLKSEIIKANKNKIVLLDVDWQGARILRKKLRKNHYSIFLLPPSFSALKKRLLKRHSDNRKTAINRFSLATKDLKHWREYDYVFINSNLNTCVKKIYKKIFQIIEEKKHFLELLKLTKKLKIK